MRSPRGRVLWVIVGRPAWIGCWPKGQKKRTPGDRRRSVLSLGEELVPGQRRSLAGSVNRRATVADCIRGRNHTDVCASPAAGHCRLTAPASDRATGPTALFSQRTPRHGRLARKIWRFSIATGAQSRISASARASWSISASVLNGPVLTRTVPSGKVPRAR